MMTQVNDYLAARGLQKATPDSLNQALQVVLDNMPTSIFEARSSGLTAEEQAVLREGGLRLSAKSGPDPVAETVVQYAAIVNRSLSAKEASKRLGLAASRIRQMIADHSLYSFLIDNHRHVPDFQFASKGKLVPNIAQVNKVLNQQLHPVEVFDWYHRPNVDLFLDDDIEATVSPLDWLRAGQNLERVVLLASRL